jgi:hypothetical protein
MNWSGMMLLAGLTLSAATHPDRWLPVWEDGDDYQEHLDTESIERRGEKVTVWTRQTFVRDKGTAWQEIEFDCARITDTILAYVRDDSNIVTHNVVRPHRGPLEIAPGSTAERMFNILCR